MDHFTAGVLALLAIGVVFVVVPAVALYFGGAAILRSALNLISGIAMKDGDAIRKSLFMFGVLGAALVVNLAWYGGLAPMPPAPAAPAQPGPGVVMMAGPSWPEGARIAAGGGKQAVYILERSRIEADGETMVARPAGFGEDAGRGWQASLVTIDRDPACLSIYRNKALPSVADNDACVRKTHVDWKGTGPDEPVLLLHRRSAAGGKAGFGSWSVYLKEGNRLTLVRRCGSDGRETNILTGAFNPGYQLALGRDAAIYRQCWDATVKQLAAGQL